MVTSYYFYKRWLQVVNEPTRAETLKSIWQSNAAYTNEIITKDNSVLDEVGKLLSLECYERNYYSLDAIFYNKSDKVPETKENTYWFKDIEIAFEHENAFNKNLYQEVAHLLITRCNLRVLVAYPNKNKEPIVNYLHEVISSCSIASEIAKKENFLIIFGYCYDNVYEWEGWVYARTHWKKIA